MEFAWETKARVVWTAHFRPPATGGPHMYVTACGGRISRCRRSPHPTPPGGWHRDVARCAPPGDGQRTARPRHGLGHRPGDSSGSACRTPLSRLDRCHTPSDSCDPHAGSTRLWVGDALRPSAPLPARRRHPRADASPSRRLCGKTHPAARRGITTPRPSPQR
jgi:hypothetical protein